MLWTRVIKSTDALMVNQFAFLIHDDIDKLKDWKPLLLGEGRYKWYPYFDPRS